MDNFIEVNSYKKVRIISKRSHIILPSEICAKTEVCHYKVKQKYKV